MDYPTEIVEEVGAFSGQPHGLYARVGKRSIDLVISVIGLVALSPLLVVLAAAVKLSSPGPVLYLQERVGRSGQRFRIVKFRSMVIGADRKGPGITTAGDCRITTVGAILRWLKLDELPQLWNVACGDMSLVGPRPELPQYVSSYPAGDKLVLSVRPGITDNASILFRHEEELLVGDADNVEYLYRHVILPRKLALNRDYISTMSFCNDLRVIIKTLVAIARPANRPMV